MDSLLTSFYESLLNVYKTHQHIYDTLIWIDSSRVTNSRYQIEKFASIAGRIYSFLHYLSSLYEHVISLGKAWRGKKCVCKSLSANLFQRREENLIILNVTRSGWKIFYKKYFQTRTIFDNLEKCSINYLTILKRVYKLSCNALDSRKWK